MGLVAGCSWNRLLSPCALKRRLFGRRPAASSSSSFCCSSRHPNEVQTPSRSPLASASASAAPLLLGRADSQGTSLFAHTFASTSGDGHFRPLPTLGNTGELMVSSIGLGTYLGPGTDLADKEYADAVTRALALGINVLDTAINYRDMRSERAIGQALSTTLSQGLVTRNQIVVCTKGGFLGFDGSRPSNPRAWIEETYIRPGVFSWSEFVAGCHCMTGTYLKNQLDKSRRNLGVDTIDVYYVHNPETQLGEVSSEEFNIRIRDAFRALEEACSEGKITIYGIATWNGFRVPSGSTGHLSLEEVVKAARDVGGDSHHFRIVQLPFNLSLGEARNNLTQILDGRQMSLLDAAKALGVSVVASASLMQANLCKGLPKSIKAKFPADLTDAQCALQFVRTTPGIMTALAGMRQVKHVEENAGIIRFPARVP